MDVKEGTNGVNKEEVKQSIHRQLLNAARDGNLDLVKELHKKGGDINCAIMGPPEANRTDGHKRVLGYAFDHGACLLFSFTQPERGYTLEKSGNSFFSRVSMLRGPGDVSKGSFKGGMLMEEKKG